MTSMNFEKQHGSVGCTVSRCTFVINLQRVRKKLISLNDVLSDKTISLRQVSTATSKGDGQYLVGCPCKKKSSSN